MIRRTAFTLIEALLVFAIIGTLATISYTTYGSSRVRARDVVRKEGLQSMRTALLLYKSNYGVYPQATYFRKINATAPKAFAVSSCNPGDDVASSAWADLSASLSPYIPRLPIDPSGGGGCTGQTIDSRPFLNSIATDEHHFMYVSSYDYTPNVPIDRFAIWAALENQRDGDRNGASNMSGKYYDRLYYYEITIPSFSGGGYSDNRPNLYAVGCKLRNATTPDQEFTAPCDPE